MVEAITIEQRNGCFRYKSGAGAGSFNTGQYLSKRELIDYDKFLVANQDRSVFDHINNNLCDCEYKRTSAWVLTGIINKIKSVDLPEIQ